ncbi:unnamed protein product [Closterium sp. NIES-64]|nr:unnamed protein product [Closterium sp. NIES-64]CAI5964019.1 unnamed protein product [Closterium sp. NIES-65]
MKVNVLFSKESNKILYLEVGKDFIDLLMSLLRMPTANLLKLLMESGIRIKGRLGILNIFSSADKLDDSYMKVDKDKILNPSPLERSSQLCLLGRPEKRGYFTCPTGACEWSVSLVSGTSCRRCAQPMSRELKLCRGGAVDSSQTLYTCRSLHRVGNVYCFHCPDCGSQMTNSLTLVGSGTGAQMSGGFVKEAVTFMVTDDLEFFPSSTIKSIHLLNSLGVKSMSDLESFETTVTRDHALALVQAALTSTSALNDVFGKVLVTNDVSKKEAKKKKRARR